MMEKAGTGSFVLEDVCTWNASHLSLVPDSAKDINTGTTAAPAPELELPKPTDGNMPRSPRVRKKPAWLNDYEY